MASEPNEPWASAMVKRGLTKAGDQPSFRRLAEEAQKVTGTTTPTVQTVINITTAKTVNPSDEIVSALAAALHEPVTKVAAWVGSPRELDEPYSPPDGSDRLSRKQREAVDHIIRVMIDDKEATSDGPPIGDKVRKPRPLNARAGKVQGERAPHLRRIDGQAPDQS